MYNVTCEWRGGSESGKKEEIYNSTRTCLCYIVIIALVVSFRALCCRDISLVMVYREPYAVLSPGNLRTTAQVQSYTSGTESQLLIKTSHPPPKCKGYSVCAKPLTKHLQFDFNQAKWKDFHALSSRRWVFVPFDCNIDNIITFQKYFQRICLSFRL